MENTNKWTLEDHIRSYPLAAEAMCQAFDDKPITVVCPKCGKAPEVLMTVDGSRTIVRCPCDYIHSTEINF